MVSNVNRINSANFTATTLKLAEQFDHPFSHLLILGNMFAQGHGCDVMTVTSSKYFVSLQTKLYLVGRCGRMSCVRNTPAVVVMAV